MVQYDLRNMLQYYINSDIAFFANNYHNKALCLCISKNQMMIAHASGFVNSDGVECC